MSGKDEVPVIVLAGEVGPGACCVGLVPTFYTECMIEHDTTYQVITLVSSAFNPL
jgi:hypothetical protein